MASGRFYYFAYGSNLLSQRLRLGNPSAKFIGVGRLPKYRLVFNTHERISAWGVGSAVASIEPHSDDIFGAVWSISEMDQTSLDKQEGVPWLYHPINISVLLEDRNTSVNCRTYLMNERNPGLPSPFYLDVILRGAIQSGLPKEYVDKLRLLKCNNNLEKCHVYDQCLEQMPSEEILNFQLDILKNLYNSKN